MGKVGYSSGDLGLGNESDSEVGEGMDAIGKEGGDKKVFSSEVLGVRIGQYCWKIDANALGRAHAYSLS